MATIPTLEELRRVDTSHDLILSLTPSQEIIQFNKESERFTGFQRDEVLHKKLTEILIPQESFLQWKDLLESIQQDMWIENFVLPIKTKANQVYMITWTGFLVKDEHGSVKDICIFGKPLKTEPMTPSEELCSEPVEPQTEPVLQEKPPEVHPDILVKTTTTIPQEILPPPKRDAPMKHGTKKMMFAREKNSTEEQTYPVASEIPTIPIEQEKNVVSSETLEKQHDATSQKLDSILQSLSELSKKYETVLNRIAELEKKDEPWEKNHKNLQTAPQPRAQEVSPSVINQPTATPDAEEEDQQQPVETEHTFFSDPFGFKRQRTELELKKQRVELRMKELESFETRLMKDKDVFHARVEEFSKWQEKLMALEAEIEKRRQELMQQENIVFEKNPQSTVPKQKTFANPDCQKGTASEVAYCDDGTLEKIPQSAAIIQRGILKQINAPFLELLGYTMEEIIEKSYFDFIALEGLADVEKYYLDRLKGDSISVYRTVFSTKDNTKIPAEVSIKQTIYNGEKAEIAIITCVDSISV